MKPFDLRELFLSNKNSLLTKSPELFQKLAIKIISRILVINRINAFLADTNRQGLDFINELFDMLNFSFTISSRDREKIPANGKLIIIANHPLGALDGLALIKAIYEIRRDVKIVANDILTNIENLNSVILPYNVFSSKAQKDYLSRIENSLNNEEAVIFFPAAEVSRFSINGVKDGKWHNGALKLAKKHQSPILPIKVHARNTTKFYITSIINKKLSMLLLPREIFSKSNKNIHLSVGNIIPSQVLKSDFISDKLQNKLLKKHLYRIDKNKPIFKTEENIISAVDKQLIINELNKSKLIGKTLDNKSIFLSEYSNSPNVVREIARLREITFRTVGEGTGKRMDFDQYDKYYKHIVLFNDSESEIIGSYRVGVVQEIIKNHGIGGLYNSVEFYFSKEFENKLSSTLELGRSFIQPRYWKSNALDYLWQGIGAFLNEYPSIKYLFGAVSISDSYSYAAKSMIVYYYKKWYSSDKNYAVSKNQFNLSKNSEQALSLLFTSDNHQDDFFILKNSLKNLGYTVPVLFRRYVELCEYSAVKFLDFGIDKAFSNVVDGLIFLDLSQVKDNARSRYYLSKSLHNN